MKPYMVLVSSALLAVGCGKKRDHSESGAAVGSSVKPAQTGSGSAAGSAHAAGKMTVPHDVPLTGEALAAQHAECVDSINTNKLDDFAKHCVHPQVVIHEVGFADYTGAEALVDFYSQLKTAVPDLKLAPQLVLVSGREVMAVLLVTGTQTGPLKLPDGSEQKPSGKRVGLLAFEHLQTDDKNRIVEQWEYMDHHTFIEQLGVGHADGAPTRAALSNGWPNAPVVVVTKEDDLEATNVAVADKLFAAIAAHKPADMLALVDDAIVEVDQADHVDHKKANLAETYQQLFTALPDLQVHISQRFAAGPYVVIEGKLVGTHRGPLEGIKATNKPVEISFAEVLKIDNGKIVERWRFRDGMALTNQLVAGTKRSQKPGAK